MKPLTAHDPETKSPDLAAENLARLKALFPELATEGPDGVAVNVDVLKALVGDQTVTDAEEKYGLNWHGKRRARQLAPTPSTGTLRPCPEDSVDWDTTQNLMIEGDNLEVLKLLQKSYAGKVKLIYIDPPYNTGKDFVYPDNFQDNIKNYLELTGQTGEGGKKLSSNTEASGRFHTDWLNMMYPRLKLARNLLREDGVMLIHMDEHEHTNVSTLLSDIFGEENILGAAVWDKKNPKGDATRLAYQHESLFFVAKNQAEFADKGGLTRRKKNAEAIIDKADQLFARIGKHDLPADLKDCAKRYKLGESCVAQFQRSISIETVNEEFAEWIRNQGFSGGEAAYSKIDDAGCVFQSVSMAWPNKKKAPDEYFIPLKHPVTGRECPIPERGRRNPPATMKKLLDAGEILFGQDHTTQPRRKYLLTQNMSENFPSVIGYGGSDDALLAALGIPFDNPKPVELARELIATALQTEGIVLDFFAGSGTAGHAVLANNIAAQSAARYILIQLPEPLDPEDSDQKAAVKFCDKLGKPRTIAELTKERLRRAGKKVREENPLFAGDLGFRVFKLASSNIRAWEPDRENLAETLEASVEHLKTDRTEQDILFELLLKLGLDLCVPIETKSIGKHEVHSIGAGSLLVCLSTSIPQADVEPLALGLVAWHQALKPAGETTVVFRDSAFADDVAKTNLTAILQQHGLENVRSL
ncbi:MAG: site-specific DNA-methyltransferase [Verrucomicrobiota bacterium]